jgi:hypothetical protein
MSTPATRPLEPAGVEQLVERGTLRRTTRSGRPPAERRAGAP